MRGPRRNEWRDHLWLAIVMVLAASVRTLGWSRWSLWLDESIQVDFCQRSLVACLKAIVADGVHPPLDYLVTWIVLHVNASDAALRSVPVLWSVLTVVAIYVRFGKERRDAAIGAGIAFALLPFAIHYGQEVRPYSLALFLVAGADAARQQHRENPRRALLLLYFVFSVLAAYTHYFTIVLLAAFFAADLVGAIHERRTVPTRLRTALVVPVATALAFLPWLAVIHARMAQPWETKPAAISIELVRTYLVGFAVDWKPGLAYPVTAGFLWAIAVVGLLCARGEDRLRLGSELFAATAGVFGLLALAGHWWDLRYAYFALLPFCRAIGEAVAWLFTRFALPRGALIPATGLAFAAMHGPGMSGNVLHARPDWRQPFDDLRRRDAAGDTVVCADPWAYFCLRGQSVRRPGLAVNELASDADALKKALVRLGKGWVVRSPAWQGSRALDDLLSAVSPVVHFPSADSALLYRFQEGRLVAPTAETEPDAPSDLPVEFECWVPAVVHASGASGSGWRSDVTLLNGSAEAAHVRLSIETALARAEVALTVGAGRQTVLADVARSLLKQDGAWPLHLRSSASIQVTARTYALGEKGSRGGAVPCLAPLAALGTGQSTLLSGLSQGAQSRTNVGLANTGREPALVAVELFSGSGTSLGAFEERVPPGEWMQRVEPFRTANEFGVADGFARISVRSGQGVYAVASVIDKQTDDPTILVAPGPLAPDRPR